MAIVNWVPDLEIGVPSIDDDHKNIVAWINDIDAMGSYNFPHKTLVYVLDCLIDYIESHFRREEAAMEDCNYKDTDTHKKVHEQFEEKIHTIHSQLMTDPNAVVSAEIIAFVVDWIAGHIVHVDALMVPYIRSNTVAVKATPHLRPPICMPRLR